jgi:2-dehydropantoate 2-reductase
LQLSIIGAGSVGLGLGARLALSGASVRFVVRRSEVARSIETHGVGLEDPATGELRQAPARAALLSDCDPAELRAGPALLCVRADDTATVAAALAARAPSLTVVSAQNDVDNEAILARHFDSVLGLVVRQTCTRDGLCGVRATGRGRLVLGRHPSGIDAEVEALGEVLGAADFDVALSPRIGEDKWLKLCINLTSSANALIRKADHTDYAFVELKARLLEEAEAALSAAGIAASSCDGQDRSLLDEIDAQRTALASGTSSRSLPLYNAVWAALDDHDKPLEADHYHRRIIDLASSSGLLAPAHETMLEAVLHAYTQRLGPECYRADALLARSETRAIRAQEGAST